MRLIELELTNFRQHASSTIRFGDGLVGILGPNGSGKSTVLEGIAWALYGSAAARGTNESIRFTRAGARSRVAAVLTFELGGHVYKVERTMHSAKVFRDGDEQPVAATLGGAVAYLTDRLGMSREEFFNTYFTGQKELQFLASMGAAERGKFLSRVLGYERLREAQERAREARAALKREREGLEREIARGADAEAERERAQAAVAMARAAAEAAASAAVQAKLDLAEMAPRWVDAQGLRERAREYSLRLSSLERELGQLQGQRESRVAERAAIVQAEERMAALRLDLAGQPRWEAEIERWAELLGAETRRGALVAEAERIRQELEATRERLERIAQAPELLIRHREEAERLGEKKREAEEQLCLLQGRWQEARQEAEATHRALERTRRESAAQLEALRHAGHEGVCQTCTQKLGREYEHVLATLAERMETLEREAAEADEQRRRAAGKPAELVQRERELAEVEGALESARTKAARCERAVEELEQLQGARGRQESRLGELEREAAALPQGYDGAAHRAAEQALRTLREKEVQLARYEAEAARREGVDGEILSLERRLQEVQQARSEVSGTLDSLSFSEVAYEEMGRRYEALREEMHRAEKARVEGEGRRALAESHLQSVEATLEAVEEARREARALDARLLVHTELDAALSGMRGDINALIRPELSEIASEFLSQLTDGRYQTLEIDEKYNIRVFDEGRAKEVLSGGEEDVANLALRLALSQMIAERAGHPLQLLILDEVFGSLDAVRRDNLVHLLQRLRERFQQVILITHIEPLQEQMDQVIHVEFEVRTGSSRVRAGGEMTAEGSEGLEDVAVALGASPGYGEELDLELSAGVGER